MAGNAKSEARRWYQQASFDLKACKWNIQGGFHSTACFLAQQAAEKALKSLLFYFGARKKALLTHSLVEMVRDCTRRLPSFGAFLEIARTLDLHYVPSRYPNGLPSGFPHEFYGKETAEEALRAAEQIIGAIAQHFDEQGQTTITSEGE